MSKFKPIQDQLLKLEHFANTKAKEIIGTEAVNHFTENFEKQSFDGLPWEEVKRRDSSSRWHGFTYQGRQKKPSNHPSRKGAKKPYKARKSNPITNFAKVATKTPILSSQRSELENSLRYRIAGKSVIIYSDVPYAKIHNEGGTAKAFGKNSFKMPKRQFIGKSKALEQRIVKKLKAFKL